MSSDALKDLYAELGVSSDSNFSATRGRLCLNMIVKNESRIIERLLGSVLSIIDTYCICDTGSTDDTAEKIRAFMAAAGKRGEVYHEPFRNFGYNRTHALERAAAWGTYALLLDADMKLVITPQFDAAKLTEAGYSIIQKTGTLTYYNTRIIKTGVGVKCVGPTHEYYDFPVGSAEQLDSLWIEDIGDGGCKSDKFERDIRLLTEALETEPANARYHFYLAQSYNHLGKHETALEHYKKRIDLGGWKEEVFYAALEAGNMCRALGRDAEAVAWWMDAYQRHPGRSESLYEIVKYYRESGKNHLAQIFCDIGSTIPYPKNDLLFIKHAVYDYLFTYESSIISYYTGRPVDHYAYLRLIGRDYHKNNVLSNYKFYTKKIKNMAGVTEHVFDGTTTRMIMGRDDDFTSSSPCIVSYGDGYLLNIRYVNYKIRGDGGYDFKHGDGKITTLQKAQWLSRDLKPLATHWFDAVADESLRYQGVEDVKVFPHRGSLLFLGTAEDSGRVAVGYGTYDMTQNKLLPRVFASPTGAHCEKNWVYFHGADGELYVVYEWSKLTIATPDHDGGAIKIVGTDGNVPAYFRDFRGSSHGVTVGNEIWFLVHMVQYCTPRHYYHAIVVVDAATFKYKRNSILFKFHGDCIEYALGLVVENERVLMSFSRMDRTSSVVVVPRSTVDKELFCIGT
jgi:tetratricopeptide (TPR) repeat protein